MAEYIGKLLIDSTLSQQISTIGINHSGLTVSLKLTRDKFLHVIAAYEVMDHIEQDPQEISSLNKDGQTSMNPAYKT